MGPSMATCREAVPALLGSLRPVDRVTLLASTTPSSRGTTRDDAEARQRAVGRLRSWGSTAFYDAVLRGLDLLDRHRGRRALGPLHRRGGHGGHATAEDVQRADRGDASPVTWCAGKGIREAGLKARAGPGGRVSGVRAFYTDRVEESTASSPRSARTWPASTCWPTRPRTPRRTAAGGRSGRGWREAGSTPCRARRVPRGRSGEVIMRLVLLVTALLLVASAPLPAQPPPAPGLRRAVDIVAVDAGVVDAEGPRCWASGPRTSRSSRREAPDHRLRRVRRARRRAAGAPLGPGGALQLNESAPSGGSCSSSWTGATSAAATGGRSQGRGTVPRRALAPRRPAWGSS